MQGNSDDDTSGSVFVLLGLFLYMAVFGVSLGPVVWLYIPEIVQPKVIPFSTASNWISCSLVIILFPILSEKVLGGHPTALFGFFGAWCLVSFIVDMKVVIETKGKP
jgi:hypothetical protein